MPHDQEFEFDPTPYMRPPVLGVADAVSLSVALLTAMPKNAGPGPRSEAKKLRKGALELQEAWGAREASAAGEDPRPADTAVDRAWSWLHDRLAPCSALPKERHPRAARAQELLTKLFPDGLKFLTLTFTTEWAESKRRLDLIDKEHLETDLNALAGPEYLSEVKLAHKRYGEVLKITKPDGNTTVNLAKHLKEVTRVVPDYALQVIAEAKRSEITMAQAADALRPIDLFRANAASRAAGAEKPLSSTPTTPIPEVPDN
ncbi:MAG: hypothetical protein HYZ28_07755 [Myxococcales bacterium]|nr:hypothetical protein [Myxococcales bacterium]